METRYAVSQKEYSGMNAAELRENFLITDLFVEGKIMFVYSHCDRIIVGGAVPTDGGIKVDLSAELAAAFTLERREMGILCLAGGGYISADGERYDMNKYDCLYLSRGVREIVLYSNDPNTPAFFYINSCPAHRECKTVHVTLDRAVHAAMGTAADCNKRVINKYIVPGAVDSCQLSMGLTILSEGSNWNTMPVHTHERRMEVYLYFDVPKDNIVFHMMGGAEDTRHIVVKNFEAVISPAWSIHSGVGTKNYSFVWGMCGENQDFGDMQGIKTTDLK